FSKEQPLFHYRGSFTSVLNYVSLNYAGYSILLVGVDFDSPEYFFQKEMEALTFETSDRTTDIIKKEQKHFSIIDENGTKMDDLMPYVLECLETTKNPMFSLNESYAVKQGWAKLL